MSEDHEKKEQENGGEKKGEDPQKDLDSILDSLKESDNTTKEEQKVPPPEEQPVNPIVNDGVKGPKVEKPEYTGSEPDGIEEILDSITEKSDQETVADMTILQRIVGIFTGPAQVFKYLRVKPDFLVPLLLAIFISAGSGFLFYDILVDEEIIPKIEQIEGIAEEQMGESLDWFEQSKTSSWRLIIPLAVGLVVTLLIFVIITLVFWFIGNVLLGGRAKFKQILSIVSYSYLIIILETIVKIPLIYSKQTLQIDMSPGILIDITEMSPFLSNFIGIFNIFHIWFLVVFGIGFSIIYGFSKLKGLVSVFIAWLLLIFVVALVS